MWQFKEKEEPKIVDITPPFIEAQDIIINETNSFSFNNYIKVTDDIDNDIDYEVKGEYFYNKAGLYNLTIIAKDKSNNISTKDIIMKVLKVSNKNPYYIKVNLYENLTLIYRLDYDEKYTILEHVFLSSVGTNTPEGIYKTTKGQEWGRLFGNVYGRYSTRITGHFLFHSVPYLKKDPSTLK